ncbi:katanin p80 subunit [Ochromonadaceae sp. CCMP2298]|nr:katanin p80 subunit [Ochromonadaceae sp. CCMP2298]
MSETPQARAALSQRLSSLRTLRQLWGGGQHAQAVQHIAHLCAPPSSDLATLADFFFAVELRCLSLDCCLALLPALEAMLRPPLPSEHVVFSAFKALASLGEAFGELIRTTRACTAGTAGGVDLSREARLAKCDACQLVFSRVGGRVHGLRRQFQASSSTVQMLEAYQSQCRRFFL